MIYYTYDLNVCQSLHPPPYYLLYCTLPPSTPFSPSNCPRLFLLLLILLFIPPPPRLSPLQSHCISSSCSSVLAFISNLLLFFLFSYSSRLSSLFLSHLISCCCSSPPLFFRSTSLFFSLTSSSSLPGPHSIPHTSQRWRRGG